MAHDALAAHARDELGLSKSPLPGLCRPRASAASFAVRAAFPLAIVALAPGHRLVPRS
jgi:hypothetical protein